MRRLVLFRQIKATCFLHLTSYIVLRMRWVTETLHPHQALYPPLGQEPDGTQVLSTRTMVFHETVGISTKDV